MDRRDLRQRGALLCATLACCAISFARPHVASGQALDSLHVRRFVMGADTLEPRVGQTFRLTITVHVDEQISELNNVTLPDLSAFQVQGDERGCTATQRGSDCTETVVLTPLAAGTVTIASTTMDALDASDRKPSRFATNSLRLQIGAAPFALGVPNGYIAELFWSTVRSFFVLLAAVVGIWFLLRYLARPRPPKPIAVAQPVVVAPPAPMAVPDFDAHFRQVVEALRAGADAPACARRAARIAFRTRRAR